MITKTIGITEAEPDTGFMLLAQKILQAAQQNLGEMSCIGKDVKSAFLTGNNIKDFVENLNDRSNSNCPILTGENYDSFKKEFEKQKNSPIQFFGEDRFNGLIVLDLSKIHKNIVLVNSLCELLENKGYGILFLNPKQKSFMHIILKYDGTEASIFSIQAFSTLFPSVAKNADSATLISPLAFSRSQVAIEKQMIKRTTGCYGALGFIKLPLNTFTDFFGYSLKNKADLLILSKPDLVEMLQVITKKDFCSIFKREKISVFVGIK